MSSIATIAIDNGTSGTIGILTGASGPATFCKMPSKEALHYSKKGNTHRRIDVPQLVALLTPFHVKHAARAFVERPFTAGPMFVNSMLLAARAFEATCIALEQVGIGYEVVDSRTWQKTMLPGVTGSAALKKASLLRGSQMYPEYAKVIKTHGDADGLLMAHYFHNSASKT